MAAQGAHSPEAILQQIRILLDQYLNLGSGTPVAGPAQQLADAIDTTGGQAGDTGMGAPAAAMGIGPPPDASMGGSLDPTGADPSVPLDKTAGAGMDVGSGGDVMPPPNTGAKTFGAANKTAGPRLEALNKKKSKGK